MSFIVGSLRRADVGIVLITSESSIASLDMSMSRRYRNARELITATTPVRPCPDVLADVFRARLRDAVTGGDESREAQSRALGANVHGGFLITRVDEERDHIAFIFKKHGVGVVLEYKKTKPTNLDRLRYMTDEDRKFMD